MSPRRAFVVAAIAAAAAGGCLAPGGGPAAIEGTSGLPPIDTSIEAVSASSPGPAAATALDLCGLTNFNPDQIGKVTFNYSSDIGIGIVTGMGLVVPGRNANKYAPLGSAPEIQTDAPLWVITSDDTWLSFPLAKGEFRNMTCVVPDQTWTNPAWLATGDIRTGDVIVTPYPLEPPTLRLPPLLK